MPKKRSAFTPLVAAISITVCLLWVAFAVVGVWELANGIESRFFLWGVLGLLASTLLGSLWVVYKWWRHDRDMNGFYDDDEDE